MEAEDPLFHLQSILSCTICRDMFRDPLTLQCGHSYCQTCIHEHWDTETTKSRFTCPNCRSFSTKRLEPKKNVSLWKVVELVSVMERRRALMATVQADIGAHTAVPAHCPRHPKELTIYCSTDHRCICYKCLLTDCRKHEVQDMEEMSLQEKKKLFDEVTASVHQKKRMKEEVERWKSKVDTIKDFHEKIISGMTAKLEQVRNILDECQIHVVESMQRDKNMMLTQAEEHVVHLERHLQDLDRYHREAEKLLRSDVVSFLEDLPHLLSVGEAPKSPNVELHENHQVEAVTKILSEVSRLLQQELPNLLHPIETSGVAGNNVCDVAGSSRTAVVEQKTPHRSLGRSSTLRAELCKDYCNLNFDPETANKYIEISHRKCKATHRLSWKNNEPGSPKRFCTWQVMCQEGLSEGSHYWEVGISQCFVELGVTYDSLKRTKEDENKIGRNASSWSLQLCGVHHSAWHDNVETKLQPAMFTEIGIHLDVPAGTLTFYGVQDGSLQCLHSFSCLFSDKVYPVFWIGEDTSVTIFTSPNTNMET